MSSLIEIRSATATTADETPKAKTREAGITSGGHLRDPQSKLTDGLHLVIDALKLNDIHTIFGLVGIPITDSWPASRKPKGCASSVSVMNKTRAMQPRSPAT